MNKRPDADLKYLYTGPRKPGRGRPKLYRDKIDCYAIDKKRIREFMVIMMLYTIVGLCMHNRSRRK